MNTPCASSTQPLPTRWVKWLRAPLATTAPNSAKTTMIGLITPPVGLVTYTLANVSGVPFYRIAKATIPFLIVLLIDLILIAIFPGIAMWLPGLLFK